MKTEISQIVLDTMLGIREGVGKARKSEFKSYLDSLIEAKKADLDINLIQTPMLTDKVKQGIKALLYSKASSGIEGGIIWTIASLSGKYGKETAEQIEVEVSMEFISGGAMNTEALKSASVEDLEKLA